MNINYKKISLIISFVFITANAFSQVGINTESPKATLDVKSLGGDYPDGIIVPYLTKTELNDKADVYGADQEGTIVYVNDALGETLAKTTNVAKKGFYYFDGIVWRGLTANVSSPWNVQGTTDMATENTQNIYQTGSVSVGNKTELPSNVTFGVDGNSSFSDLVKIGKDTTFNTSAQINLVDKDKGILINRVALTNKDIKAPVVNAVDGMLVYNTTDNEATGLTPGLYYWYIEEWVKIQYKVPQASSLSLVNLKTSCTSIIQSANTTDKGTLMDMGDIEIQEDGAYAFSFRLYGSVTSKPTNNPTMICYYIALLANGKLADTAEMDIIPGINVNAMTYTIVLAGNFKAGDILTFKLSHNQSTNYPWSLNAINDNTRANRTSMVWWKLS